MDSDGLALAQRRPALWVSSLLQEKQRADALKCGGFQSPSDSSSRWVMTCEIHGTKMTQFYLFNEVHMSMTGHQTVYLGIFHDLVTIRCVPLLYSITLELHVTFIFWKTIRCVTQTIF